MAPTPKTRNATLLLMVMLSFLACVVAKEHLARVFITNGLEGRPKLTVHCKSKDDDLGFHDLAPGQTWEFQFYPRLVTGTLFFCRFMWPGTFHYFDIYDENRDTCNDCCWTVRANGPCFCPCNGPCSFTDCRAWN